MKIAPWRVWNLLLGLALVLLGIGTMEIVAFVHFILQPIPWTIGAAVFVGLVTLGPVAIGVLFLIPLCDETEDDRQRQAELDRLVKGPREG